MFIIEGFGLYLIYLLIFSISYFSYEKIISWEKIIKIKRPKILDDFVQGIFIGFVTLISYLISGSIQPFYSPLFFSTAVLMIIVKNEVQSLFSVVPSLVYMVFAQDVGSEMYVIVSTLFFTLFSINIIKIFIDKTNRFIYIYTTLIVAFLFSFIFTTYYITDENYVFAFDNVSLIAPYTLFGYIFLDYSIKVSLSSKILYESTNYSFLSFYRSSIAKDMVNEFIFQNKIKRGALVIYQIESSKGTGDEIDVDLLVNKRIQEKISALGVSFVHVENKYGFFVPFIETKSLTKEETINEIRKIVHPIISEGNRTLVQEENQEDISVSLKAGFSVYGIDSQSVSKLMAFSNFALTDQPPEKVANAFKYKLLQNSVKENEKLFLMDKKLNLDDFSNYFTPLFDLNDNSHFATLADIESISEFQYYRTVNERVYQTGWQDMFNRYFGANAILSSKNNPVIFEYSLNVFEKDFDKNDFAFFCKRNKMDISKIFLLFKKDSFKRIKDYSKVEKNISDLKAMGVKFILDANISLENWNTIIEKPKYILSEFKKIDNTLRNFKGMEIMVSDISSEKELVSCNDKNIRFVGGKQILKDFNFRKIDKKSKIYIENVLKGSLNG